MNKTPIQLMFAAALLMASAQASLAREESPAGWYRTGQALMSERLGTLEIDTRPRNVILFVGDGMSLATVAAARILEGQMRGESGEENFLHFENFPYTGLAKTYNTNRQTPDSAGTMTAMATGVKTFAGSIGVDQTAFRGDCSTLEGARRVSLLDLAKLAGLGSGIVTTTRVTHATPAALYAHAVDREWETDRGIPPSQRDAGCHDIARQLIEYRGGTINVVFGGGRRAFLPGDATDPEDPDQRGHRGDGRNLIEEWQERNENGRYVWNLEQFEALPDRAAGPVLGLFAPSHMNYEHDRPDDRAGEPSLAEMTAKAIELLADDERGYFLMVEGGRIDHAHHANNAWRALTDALAFARAVEAADRATGDDTLILVTADHGHALNFGGYGTRGNPILGLGRRPESAERPERPMVDDDGRPMTVLSYANGPGYRGGDRPDFEAVDPQDPDFLQESAVGLWSATHAGEDVPVYARGPGAAAIRGVFEQNAIFHAIVESLPGLKEAAEALSDDKGLPSWPALLCRLQEDSDSRC